MGIAGGAGGGVEQNAGAWDGESGGGVVGGNGGHGVWDVRSVVLRCGLVKYS